MDILSLRYPRKSHRKLIQIPTESSVLAELMGIEFGDGGINNPWQVVITLNADKDKEYSYYVMGLFQILFGIDSETRVRGERTLQIIVSSTSLVDFLVDKGAIRGNKLKGGLQMPKWVQENEQYTKAFVRGLVDTDGCLYVHHHMIHGVHYRNIGFCFTSGSEKLIYDVAGALNGCGIIPHIANDKQRIYLYDKNSVLKYLQIFGSANPRISDIYNHWKGAGVV